MTSNRIWFRRAGFVLLAFCALNLIFGVAFAGFAIWASPDRRAIALFEAILSVGLAALNAGLGAGLIALSRRGA